MQMALIARKFDGCRPLIVFACLLLSLLCSQADAIPTDGLVHVLTEASFDSSVRQYPYAFVEFYAPWCGHCKSLEPEWNKLAKSASAYSVLVAKVDAIAEDKLAQSHSVQSFPTLKLFKGDPDVFVTYSGARTATSMQEWLHKSTEIEALATTDATATAIKAWETSAKLKVLGLLSGKSEEDRHVVELLKAASFMLNPSSPGSEVPVAAVPLPGGEMEKLDISGVALPGIVLLREYELEEKVLVYEGDVQKGVQPFMAWMAQRSVPALIPATRETEKLFLKDVEPGNALAIFFGDDVDLVNAIRKLAIEMSSSQLKFVHAKTDSFGESVAKNVGVDVSEFPELAIWQFGETEDDDRVLKLTRELGLSAFPTDAPELEAASRQFVKGWRAGTLVVKQDKAAATKSGSSKSKASDSANAKTDSPSPVQKPMSASSVPAKKSKGPKKVPCPVDADVSACARWCSESSSDTERLAGTLGGKPCEEWTPKDELHEETTCTCYDEDFTEVKLSCKPECRTARGKAGKSSVAGIAISETSDSYEGTCAAGDASCNAGSTAAKGIYDDDYDIAVDF
jgi:protein disulfide-isomerase-like protein